MPFSWLLLCWRRWVRTWGHPWCVKTCGYPKGPCQQVLSSESHSILGARSFSPRNNSTGFFLTTSVLFLVSQMKTHEVLSCFCMLKVLDEGDKKERARLMHAEAAFPRRFSQPSGRKRRRGSFCWLYKSNCVCSLPVVKHWSWAGNPEHLRLTPR